MVTMLLSVVFVMAACYSSLTTSFTSELESEANAIADVISDKDISAMLGSISANMTDKRITLIDASGNVLFDNEGNYSNMQNHLNRPEIVAAKLAGSGTSSRRSSTLHTRQFYYAVQLNNGAFLRIGDDFKGVYSMFYTVLVAVLFVTAMLYLLTVIVAYRLTENIVEPIKNAASDANFDNNEMYEEIKPFIERILSQNKKLAKTDEMRREFTANVSHELKTPLTSIHGYAQIINSGIAKPDDVASFVKKIEKESSRLIILVDDIIRLSKLDEGQKAEQSDNDMLVVAREVAEQLKQKAAVRGITINVSGSSSRVYINESLLTQLVYNLCDNAIKYNKDGGVVDINVCKKRLTVSDTGIGIANEHIERIFERFFRVDKSRSKKVDGTGLGLSIVKHIVLGAGGTIDVQSTEGEGTTFTVDFS